MKIVIIKYNAGNIKSVDYALQRLGLKAEITNNHEKILSADKVIFPGVGESSTTMSYLKKNNLDTLLKQLKQPVLGICLGMQLMCEFSDERNTECIGIFKETVKKFRPEPGMENITKVPQMGWNNIYNLKNGIFDPSLENKFFYFTGNLFN